MKLFLFYAAILLDRITGFVCSSVRLSVMLSLHNACHIHTGAAAVRLCPASSRVSQVSIAE